MDGRRRAESSYLLIIDDRSKKESTLYPNAPRHAARGGAHHDPWNSPTSSRCRHRSDRRWLRQAARDRRRPYVLDSTISFDRNPTPGARRLSGEPRRHGRGGRYFKYRPPLGLVGRWIGLVRSRLEDSVALVRQARPRPAPARELDGASAMPPWRTLEAQVRCASWSGWSTLASSLAKDAGELRRHFLGEEPASRALVWATVRWGRRLVPCRRRERGLSMEVPLQLSFTLCS
jgi:hypothetical protein